MTDKKKNFAERVSSENNNKIINQKLSAIFLKIYEAQGIASELELYYESSEKYSKLSWISL